MREQEANTLLLLNSIKYNMLSFHSGDVGQTAQPREREKSNIRTLGRIHKVKAWMPYQNPNPRLPPPLSSRDNIDRCIMGWGWVLLNILKISSSSVKKCS